MAKKKKSKKAFTLIELLVVIAIIGILSAIVLVSVNQARVKAKDAAIKASMETIRSAAEMAYDVPGVNHYGGVCNGTGADSTLAGTGDFARINAAVKAQNGQINVWCQNLSATAAAYVAWSPLASSATTYFCVDSTGVAKEITSAPADASTACP